MWENVQAIGDHICHRLIQNQGHVFAVFFISGENQMTCRNPSVIDKLHNPVKLSNIILVMMIDCIGRCKSNCPTFTTAQSYSSLQKEKEKGYKRCSIFLFFYNGCWAVSFRSFLLHRDYSVCKQFRNFIENKNWE
jgi:hypothetical protein